MKSREGKQKKRESYNPVTVSLLMGVFLMLADRLFWQTSPVIANLAGKDLKTGLSYIVDLFLSMGSPLVLLSLGYLFAGKKETFPEMIKIWLNTIVSSLLVLLFLLLIPRQFFLSMLYDSLFPILRNSYPEILALLFLLLFMPILKGFAQKCNRKTFIVLVLFFFGLGTVFNKDIFGFTEGASWIFHLAMGAIGVFLFVKPVHFRWHQIMPITLGSWGILALLNLMMPYVSYVVRANGTTANRFNDSSSLFSVIAFIATFYLLSKIKLPVRFKNSYLRYLALTSIIFSSNIYLLAFINSKISTITGTNTIYKILFSLVYAASTMIGVTILYLLVVVVSRRLPLYHKIESEFKGISIFNVHQTIDTLWDKGQGFIKQHLPELLTYLFLYLLAYLSMLAMNLSVTLSLSTSIKHNAFLYTFFTRQPLVLLNFGIFLLLYSVIRALTNRFWVASIFTSLFIVLWTVANRLKMITRGEPIMPSEAKMVSAYGSLLTMVDRWILISALLVIIILTASVIVLEWKRARKKLTLGQRLIRIAVFLVLLPSVFYLNHKGGIAHTLSSGIGNNPMFYNQAVAAQINGPTVQFLNNIDIKIMDEPEGYSQKRMEQLAKKYQLVSESINQNRTNDIAEQTVVFNLSESFVDPFRLDPQMTKVDPIPTVRSLMEQNTSGTMVSSGYGGGTANMEFMTLTGFTLSNFSPTLVTPYTQLDSKFSFNQLFPTSKAIHTYYGVYYSRISVYKRFGFDSFMYDGSEDKLKHLEKIDKSPYLSDRTAYLNTLDVINETKGGGFVQLVSMQNHFPYNLDIYKDTQTYETSGRIIINDDVKKNATNFVTGLHYTDQAVKEFIEKINQIDKPITVVFYGDHLPGIFPLDPLKQGLLMHSTDYFIYSNRYAKEHGAVDVSDESIQYVGPNDFIALVLKQTNSKVDGYGALLTKVQEELPAMSVATANVDNTENTHTEFTSQNGETLTEEQLTPEQKELLQDYKLVQYDLNAGEGYLEELQFVDAFASKQSK